MTLDEVWKECHKMWNMIDLDEDINIEKCDYLEERGIDLRYNCYFCDWAIHKSGRRSLCVFTDLDKIHLTACSECPGRMIDPEFHCMRPEYDFEDEPYKFRDKINEMYDNWHRENG